VYPSLFSPGTPPARLHPIHLPAQHARGPAVVGLLLDRSGVGAGSNLARNPDNADHNDAELGPG